MNESPNKKEKKHVSTHSFSWKRAIPLLVLIFLGTFAYFFGISQYLTFDVLKENRKTILAFVDQHWVLTPLLFMFVYTIVVILCIPGAVFFTVFAGFLFLQPLSTVYSVIATTLGSCIIFCIAKTSFSDYFLAKSGPFFQKMEKGFRKNSISYLFFLRLFPFFPFWLINLGPALFGVRLSTFTWIALLGAIPSSFVYSQAGTGLGAFLDTEEKFSFASIFNWHLRFALIALGVLALIPIFLKQFRKKYDR